MLGFAVEMQKLLEQENLNSTLRKAVDTALSVRLNRVVQSLERLLDTTAEADRSLEQQFEVDHHAAHAACILMELARRNGFTGERHD